MVSILISIQTDDERQIATEALGKALRAGIEKQQAKHAVDAAPASLASGLYGAAIYSHAARSRGGSARDSEKKLWRRGRQYSASASRDPSVHARTRNESLDPFADEKTDHASRTSERVRRHTTDGGVSINERIC